MGDLQSEVEAGRIQVERLREGVELQLPASVLFGRGSSVLSPSGQAVLRRVAQRIRGLEDRVEVHGHTDALPMRGGPAARYPSNWELAGARAAQVVRMLVAEGVAPSRVVAVSHGEHDPVSDHDTPEGHARNRRIEIRLLPAGPAGTEADTPAP